MVGCVRPDGDIRLIQPHLTGWESEVNLLSRQVYWSTDGVTDRLLAEFPLPGAMTGAPTYLLYLRWPSGERQVGAGHDAALRGFFIQTRGRHAGLALVTGGSMTVRGSSQKPGATRGVELDLACEEGSGLRGRLRARRDDWTLERFETHRYPTDVQALIAPRAAGEAPREEESGAGRFNTADGTPVVHPATSGHRE